MSALYASVNAPLSAADKNKIISVDGQPWGVFRSYSPPLVQVAGAAQVATSTCVAGDWFTSDVDGVAVKTEAGFALGRILADPVEGLALCVVSPVFL